MPLVDRVRDCHVAAYFENATERGFEEPKPSYDSIKLCHPGEEQEIDEERVRLLAEGRGSRCL